MARITPMSIEGKRVYREYLLCEYKNAVTEAIKVYTNGDATAEETVETILCVDGMHGRRIESLDEEIGYD